MLKQHTADTIRHHIQGNGVEAAFRDDDIGVALARLDKLQMHGTDRAQILVDDGFEGAASLGKVTSETTDKSNVGVGIHENLDVKKLAQRRFSQDQNPFDHDDREGFDTQGLWETAVLGEVVYGNVHGLPVLKLLKVAELAGLANAQSVNDEKDAESTLRQAVKQAAELAEAGDIVLLSPACASWDMFASYEQRGSIFKQSAHTL